MSELSKEQVDKAAKVACNTYAKSNDGWPHSCSHDDWRDAVTAAAQFLQYPIAPPTVAECTMFGNERQAYNTHIALGRFIERRNAAMNPPVDPLKGARYAGERNVQYAHSSETMHVIEVDHPNGRWESIFCKTKAQADAILAALDEK